ncbi:TAXI family TRAP transporter solute-binding subunit [Rhodopseudomonas sp. P2A-2r]|uniref:TAXI family TRAP transporter solute-binding subunit n=1 Tax=Rhodopseudomonas sp. P2A-2r TaxID=2991972 RepID=UPI002234E109|nr:TAXI family TRAP transporter solute-binding subunit [Rhodopseudomonas sp. P2A-2r]UZE51154.1 TAXI family TRAP transporter solute-binding subunit [Rhodopseudomonas sp. P2A-2r]
MTIIRIVCAAALLFGAAAAAQEGGKAIPETIVSLGTATPGGGFPVYGAAFTAAMQAADPTLKIAPRNTKGSYENIPLLEAGQLDLGLVAGEPAYEAFMGIGRKPTPLKIFSAISSNPGMFVVRAESPYKTIRDLVGKPVAFGAKGSGLPILARYVLDGIGLDQEKDFTAVYLDRAGDGPAMVLDGRVAALWGAGIGWPGFKAMSESPGGARFIAPDEAEIARIRAKHTFLKPMLVPAGSYPHQDLAISSLGSWSFVLARADLPDDVAYRLAKTLHAAEADLGARLPQAKETTAANTVAAAPRVELIHPGVLRYFKEIGLVK